jgi:anaerobic ribonucleoside-triphosphate reductase activating protein
VDLSIGAELAQTSTEGPGERYAVWVQGCPLRCPGCCNPELLRFEGGTRTTPEALLARIQGTEHIEGVSFLGGEPFAQASALAVVAGGAQKLGLSVLIFSGFTREELEAREDARALLAVTDVLVDGPYDRDQPDFRRRWIGSRNQRVHFLSDHYGPHDARFQEANEVELRWSRGTLVINGRPWGPGLP